MAQSKLAARPLSGSIGAEIRGLDLSGGMDAGAVAAIRAALLEHLVLCIRDQRLTPAQFMRVAECFGEPVEYPFVKGIEGFPKIIEVSKLEHERINFGGLWHSDTTYQRRPPMGTLLLARQLPPIGGDTLFANQYLAYETLSSGMKRMLEGLVGVNISTKAAATHTRVDRVADSGVDRGVGRGADGGAGAAEEMVREHPAVRTHPETGRKALFVNFAHTVRFKDMSEEESAPLLDYLFRHQTRPEFTCRLGWEPGTLTFWDNRAAQHNPINDYHGHKRVMHRITLKGDTPV